MPGQSRLKEIRSSSRTLNTAPDGTAIRLLLMTVLKTGLLKCRRPLLAHHDSRTKSNVRTRRRPTAVVNTSGVHAAAPSLPPAVVAPHEGRALRRTSPKYRGARTSRHLVPCSRRSWQTAPTSSTSPSRTRPAPKSARRRAAPKTLLLDLRKGSRTPRGCGEVTQHRVHAETSCGNLGARQRRRGEGRRKLGSSMLALSVVMRATASYKRRVGGRPERVVRVNVLVWLYV
eukprot:3069071-Pleurochrysis_carterae.AAC.1